MANVAEISEQLFEKEVLQAKLPVLLDFFAPWCGHCTKLLPLIDELSGDMEGKVKVCKVNVDENRDLALAGAPLIRGQAGRFDAFFQTNRAQALAVHQRKRRHLPHAVVPVFFPSRRADRPPACRIARAAFAPL